MTIEQTQIELIQQAHRYLGKAMFAAATMERALVNAAADHRLAAARAEGRELGADPWKKAASEGIDKNLKRLGPRLTAVDGLEDRLTAAKADDVGAALIEQAKKAR
ncbi:hypothetical protein [Streptomyces sp. NBC_01244]|uniref:hypothetical protein n=1 Tax=Streptomyces sp. NBC_01244 TaxID=2903797 RepID=UPI002E134251|nr:hypothetical protein OG247_44420 [Streptomyces sp. NBC_01244]